MRATLKVVGAILDGVPGWLWAMAVAALMGTNLVSVSHIAKLEVVVANKKTEVAEQRIKTSEVKAEFDQYKLDQAEQRIKDEAAERKRERDLQAKADKLRSTKNAEIDRLRADVRDLRYGLQHLPSRLSAGTAGSGIGAPAQGGAPGQVCDGGFIHREVAGDLAAESERAETIRLNYLELIDLYERAQR